MKHVVPPSQYWGDMSLPLSPTAIAAPDLCVCFRQIYIHLTIAICLKQSYHIIATIMYIRGRCFYSKNLQIPLLLLLLLLTLCMGSSASWSTNSSSSSVPEIARLISGPRSCTALKPACTSRQHTSRSVVSWFTLFSPSSKTITGQSF